MKNDDLEKIKDLENKIMNLFDENEISKYIGFSVILIIFSKLSYEFNFLRCDNGEFESKLFLFLKSFMESCEINEKQMKDYFNIQLRQKFQFKGDKIIH